MKARRIAGAAPPAGLLARAWLAFGLQILVFTASPVCAALAAATSTADKTLQPFDIPAQPLSSAVEAYAVATGAQIIYDHPLDGRSQSPGVHGVLSPQAALTRLLAGTGLIARFNDAHNIVLSPADSAAAAGRVSNAGPPAGLPVLALGVLEVQGPAVIEASPSASFDPGFYETLIRSGVRQALANNQATSKGDYGIRLSLWIAPTGKISRLQILRSSGDAARDKATILALQDLMLEAPPPPRLLQPVALDIQAKTKK